MIVASVVERKLFYTKYSNMMAVNHEGDPYDIQILCEKAEFLYRTYWSVTELKTWLSQPE